MKALTEQQWRAKARRHQEWESSWRAEMAALEATIEGLDNILALQVIDRARAIKKRIARLNRIMARHRERAPVLFLSLERPSTLGAGYCSEPLLAPSSTQSPPAAAFLFLTRFLRSMTGASTSRQVDLSPSQPTLPGSVGTIGREQFLILDGIRGVAALFVMMRHTSDMWGFMPFRSYLAVDLFFILSGFVIAHAYDRKLTRKQLSRRDFMLLRVIRLYPMYALSVLVCTGIFFRDLMITSENLSPIFVPGTLMFCFANFFLPFHMIGYSDLFPINYVFWSLFYELLVNGMYSAIRPRLSTWINVGILLIASVALVYAARQHGSLDLGSRWGITQFVGGGARAVFGIFLGLVLYLRRAKLMLSLRLKGSNLLVMCVITASLASPSVGHRDWVIDVILVLIVFPLCILSAAHGAVRHGAKLLSVLGTASYPVYLFHLPAARLFENAIHNIENRYVPISGLVFAALLIAVAVIGERVYDLPVRRWLKSRYIHNQS